MGKNDPQNKVVGKQRFNFLASINQPSFPGTNRSSPVNPRVGKKRQKGYYRGNEKIRTIKGSETSFFIAYTSVLLKYMSGHLKPDVKFRFSIF